MQEGHVEQDIDGIVPRVPKGRRVSQKGQFSGVACVSHGLMR